MTSKVKVSDTLTKNFRPVEIFKIHKMNSRSPSEMEVSVTTKISRGVHTAKSKTTTEQNGRCRFLGIKK